MNKYHLAIYMTLISIKYINTNIFYIGNETTTQLPSNDFSECFYGDYILDHFDNGICNDVLNTPKCLFDGGDCCDGDTNDNSTCLTCFCFEEVNTFGNKIFC